MSYFQFFITHLRRFHPRFSLSDDAEGLLGLRFTTDGFFLEVPTQERQMCEAQRPLRLCSSSSQTCVLVVFPEITDKFKTPGKVFMSKPTGKTRSKLSLQARIVKLSLMSGNST